MSSELSLSARSTEMSPVVGFAQVRPLVAFANPGLTDIVLQDPVPIHQEQSGIVCQSTAMAMAKSKLDIFELQTQGGSEDFRVLATGRTGAITHDYLRLLLSNFYNESGFIVKLNFNFFSSPFAATTDFESKFLD